MSKAFQKVESPENPRQSALISVKKPSLTPEIRAIGEPEKTQNKPNFQRQQIAVSNLSTTGYCSPATANCQKTNPIQSQFSPRWKVFDIQSRR